MALLLVGRPMVRAADALAYNRDRRTRIRQFRCVDRVTLVPRSEAAASPASRVLSALERRS